MKNLSELKFFYATIWIFEIIASAESFENENIVKKLPSILHSNLFRLADQRIKSNMNTPCTCGVFLDAQLSNENAVYSNENPSFMKQLDIPLYPCGIRGTKACMKQCVDMILKYMPNIGPLVCASIERNCIKEKAHLFIKNCDETWKNTGFSAGKEFCCDKGLETKCRFGMAQQESNISELFDVSSFSKYIPDFLMNFADRATNIASSVLRIH